MYAYFNIFWALLFVNIGLYNYLYFSVVKPTLGEYHGASQYSLLASKQFQDFDEYVRILNEGKLRPWQFYPARVLRSVTVGILFVFLLGALLAALKVLQ